MDAAGVFETNAEWYTRSGFLRIELFGKRSKAGIWKLEILSSLRGVRDTWEDDMVEKKRRTGLIMQCNDRKLIAKKRGKNYRKARNENL